MNAITDTIKNFDFNKFNWREAVSGPDGKSSVGKWLCLCMGIALIIGTLICFTLLVIKHVSPAVQGDTLTVCFTFIGTQFAAILAYLKYNKDLEIKSGVEHGRTQS